MIPKCNILQMGCSRAFVQKYFTVLFVSLCSIIIIHEAEDEVISHMTGILPCIYINLLDPNVVWFLSLLRPGSVALKHLSL